MSTTAARAAKVGRLTAMQAAFVVAYCGNGGDATRAAKEAGAIPSSAAVTASKWLRLTKIQDAIARGKRDLVVRTRFTGDRVLRELKTMAFSSVEHYQVNAETGRLELAPGAPRDAMRAVASVKYKTETDKAGTVTRSVEFRLWDKPGTIKMAGKHVGLFPDKDREAIEAAAMKLVTDEVKKAEERKRLAAIEEKTVDVDVVPPTEATTDDPT